MYFVAIGVFYQQCRMPADGVQSMKFVRQSLFCAAVVCLGAVTSHFRADLTTAAHQKAPLSERVVAYQIEANYHPKNHSLDAQETLTWTNYTGQPQDRLPFHLYLNAFQPKSTFIREGYEVGNRDVPVGESGRTRNSAKT